MEGGHGTHLCIFYGGREVHELVVHQYFEYTE
jgi:hypothetical protein